jgi:hypothetical protein
MNEPQSPFDLCDSLVEGFGPTICNRRAILWNEIDDEIIDVDHNKEVEDLLNASEQRMHFRQYCILRANTNEVKAHRNAYMREYNKSPMAQERIKGYSQLPKREAYGQTEAEILLKASEKRMHIEMYHILWLNTEEAKAHNREYQKEFAQLPEQKKRIKEYGQRPERQDYNDNRIHSDDYRTYQRGYQKEYRKRPYVQEREDEYLARPDVKARMKENNRKQAKTETRTNYLYKYRRSEKHLEYRREYEGERHKSDLNFHIAYLIRKRLNIVMKQYGEGKKYSTQYYGVDLKAIIEKLGKPPEDGKVYHIDHIRPCCSFDLTDPKQIKECFAPENHRWLTKEENLRKVKFDRKMSIRSSKKKMEGYT